MIFRPRLAAFSWIATDWRLPQHLPNRVHGIAWRKLRRWFSGCGVQKQLGRDYLDRPAGTSRRL